ncbi:hypothetical protein HPB50_010839 [Hyalomma asiaticum]|uniref:Uncharacterized protein n=1 Tax=Hyalomma asiaticum TaxID=266040 RepID=A0ACB7RN05_HYAAI|nr:hypothetical protein HPB50_010839 [Hyalomma asiaticum]
MPLYSYLCTVTHHGNQTYLAPDGICDFLFYDSVYKIKEGTLSEGISKLRPSAQYFIKQASKYNKTQFGLSFGTETVFTPSMFISIAHITFTMAYSKDCRIFPVSMASLPTGLKRGKDYDGHTVNESLAVLRKVVKMGLAIPTAISFTFKGLYYLPKFADDYSPKVEEFMLFKKCAYFDPPFYGDPKALCGKPDWTPVLPELAYSLSLKRTITYLTGARIATLACDAKQFYLDLTFNLAGYDVGYDHAAPCEELGFNTQRSSYGRVVMMRELMNFLRTNYTKPTDNFVCIRTFAA